MAGRGKKRRRKSPAPSPLPPGSSLCGSGWPFLSAPGWLSTARVTNLGRTLGPPEAHSWLVVLIGPQIPLQAAQGPRTLAYFNKGSLSAEELGPAASPAPASSRVPSCSVTCFLSLVFARNWLWSSVFFLVAAGQVRERKNLAPWLEEGWLAIGLVFQLPLGI